MQCYHVTVKAFCACIYTICVISLRHPVSHNRTFNMLQVTQGLCRVLTLFPVGLSPSSFLSPSVKISLFILQTSP